MFYSLNDQLINFLTRLPWVSVTLTNSCNPLIVVGVLGVFTSATMGLGVTGFGTEGTVIGAVIKLVSARVAAISLTPGASGTSLTIGATNRSDRGEG